MSLALALDALETLHRNPSSSILWRHLSLSQRNLNEKEKGILVDLIVRSKYQSNYINWLKYSALDYITGNSDWRRKQAELACDNTSPEAIMELLNLNWALALENSTTIEAFSDQIYTIDVWQLQQLVAQKLTSLSEEVSNLNTKKLRVAIYTPQIASMRHGGTALSLNLASLLLDGGIEIEVFAAQETAIPAIEAYKGGTRECRREKLEKDALKLHGSGKCELHLSNEQFSILSRFNKVLWEIEKYEPDIVLFVGFMSPVVHALYKKYPILAMSVHTSSPPVPMDIWLSNQLPTDNKFWLSQSSASTAYFPYRFWPRGKAAPIDMEELEIPKQATVLVTAGYRFATDIVPPWSTRMIDFLETNEHVYWLLVGVTSKDRRNGLVMHDRIRISEPQKNLESWLAASDIYVGHPGIGGGEAAAMAMEQGIPVLSFENTDGGNKVGEYAVSSTENYFELLSTWANNLDSRKKAGMSQKEIFNSRLDISGENAKRDLKLALSSTIELGKKRIGIECE